MRTRTEKKSLKKTEEWREGGKERGRKNGRKERRVVDVFRKLFHLIAAVILSIWIRTVALYVAFTPKRII